MIIASLILILSTALFFFYVQTFCEKVLRREFGQPYYQEVVRAIRLEFPHLREALALKASLDYPQVRLALKCDFSTLAYLLRNSDPRRHGLLWQEKVLAGYFRLLLFLLPFRYALGVGEKEAVLKLTSILQYFANLTGEKAGTILFGNAANGPLP